MDVDQVGEVKVFEEERFDSSGSSIELGDNEMLLELETHDFNELSVRVGHLV